MKSVVKSNKRNKGNIYRASKLFLLSVLATSIVIFGTGRTMAEESKIYMYEPTEAYTETDSSQPQTTQNTSELPSQGTGQSSITAGALTASSLSLAVLSAAYFTRDRRSRNRNI